jgi:signal transduction histidine kinase
MDSLFPPLNPIRSICLTRFIAAIIFAVFAFTDPTGSTLQWEFDDVFAVLFLTYSLLAAAILCTNWLREFRYQNYFALIDVVALLVIPFDIEPDIVGFLVISPILLILCVIETSHYWGAKFSSKVTVILISGILIEFLAQNPNHLDWGFAFRLFLVLVFISGRILWLTQRGGLVSMPKLKVGSVDNRNAQFEAMASYAMDQARAGGVAICWEDSEEGAVFHRAGSLANSAHLPKPASSLVPNLHRSPLLFDTTIARGLTFGNQGLATEIALTKEECHSLESSGVTKGAAVSVPSELLPAWLIFGEIAAMNCNDLLRVEQIADELSHAIDRFEVSVTNHQLAQHRLRETIARDLHDGVAQSLAGARFLLVALQRKFELAKLPSEELTPITSALDIEHRHVRELIDRLRAKEMEFEERNLGKAIYEMAARQAVHWQVEIQVGKTPSAIKVTGELSFELRQIIREAIANAARHGQATQIKIGIQAGYRNLRITIEDNGKGFSGQPPLVVPRTISERVDGLKGLSMVRSQPGATLVQFTIPLER